MSVALRYDSPPLPDEKWMWVPGHEGQYDVSDLGRVRTYYKSFGRKGRKVVYYPVDFLWPSVGPQGYYRIGIHVGTSVSVSLHSIIMAAFVGPRPPNTEILHRDGDPSNNELANLRYGTHEENTQDWMRHARDGKPSTKTVEWSLARTRDRRVGMHINLLRSSLEKWKPVVGYEGRYDVSERGHIRSYVEASCNGQRGTSNRGERCGSAKFCDDEVRLMRAWCASGYSQKSVGEAFHCDSGTTSMIVNRKTWRHI